MSLIMSFFPPFESEKLKIWKEALGGDYKNYAAKFHDIIFYLSQVYLQWLLIKKNCTFRNMESHLLP